MVIIVFVCAHRVCVFVCHSAHVTVRGRVVLHFSPAFSCSRAAARFACPAPLPTELSCWPKLLIFFSFLFLCFYIWTNFPFLPRLPVPPCSLTPSTLPLHFSLKKGQPAMAYQLAMTLVPPLLFSQVGRKGLQSTSP